MARARRRTRRLSSASSTIRTLVASTLA
jgi:hypothetical protein